uniref:Uncharacterized protein n=1 Tax=Maylandia zebra TaxID=106582 RepID=A0A3P9CT83_9CICH
MGNFLIWDPSETKVEMCDCNAEPHVWQKPNTARKHRQEGDDLGILDKYSRVKCEAICQAAKARVKKQDNDPKHSSTFTTEWLKRKEKKRITMLQRPSQSPEMSWWDLKRSVYK